MHFMLYNRATWSLEEEKMTSHLKFILFINVLTFMIMGYDKLQAKRQGWRVPERMLMAMALLMGAGGIYAGMYVFRHKTKHTLFQFGIPLLLIFNILAIHYLTK